MRIANLHGIPRKLGSSSLLLQVGPPQIIYLSDTTQFIKLPAVADGEVIGLRSQCLQITAFNALRGVGPQGCNKSEEEPI
jgi:hypothetical protein